MSRTAYEQVTISGGNVQLGDQYLNHQINQIFVLDGVAINPETLCASLASAQIHCEAIEKIIPSFTHHNGHINELHRDVADLRALTSTLEMLLEDDIETKYSNFSLCQKALLDITSLMTTYKQTLVRAEEGVRQWRGAGENPTEPAVETTTNIFRMRQQLSAIRTKMSIAVCLMNWASVQNLHLQNLEQVEMMLQELVKVTHDMEEARLAGVPSSTLLSYQNLAEWDNVNSEHWTNAFTSPTKGDDVTTHAPSMQVSTVDVSASSIAHTFVTALERRSPSSCSLTTLAPQSSTTPTIPSPRNDSTSMELDQKRLAPRIQALVRISSRKQPFLCSFDTDHSVEEMKHDIGQKICLPCALFNIQHSTENSSVQETIMHCDIRPPLIFERWKDEFKLRPKCSLCDIQVIFDVPLPKTKASIHDLQVAVGALRVANPDQCWIYQLRELASNGTSNTATTLFISFGTLFVYGDLSVLPKANAGQPVLTSDLTAVETEQFDTYCSKIFRRMTGNIRHQWRRIVQDVDLTKSFSLNFDDFILEAYRRGTSGCADVEWYRGRPRLTSVASADGTDGRAQTGPPKSTQRRGSGRTWSRRPNFWCNVTLGQAQITQSFT